MISQRTRISIVQFLGLQEEEDFVDLLLEKYEIPRFIGPDRLTFLTILRNRMTEASEDQLLSLIDEILRTKIEFRQRADAGQVFDDRFEDLRTCLFLDGFGIDEYNNKLVPQDPSIVDTPPLDDDLTNALNNSGLAEAQDVKKKLNDSADSFRKTPPNYNASLNDSRVALQTLATSIANIRIHKFPGSFDKGSWGSVLLYLRMSGFITEDEEKGLAGVFRFVSPGSHLPLGLSEMELARLGRTFVLGMCWFLIRRFTGETV